tara:strand:- start:2353 stop:3027 length:675 start_codon:yes stop_codon:yes gene_type:complete
MDQSVRLPIFLLMLTLFLVFYPYLHQQFPDQVAILEGFFFLLMLTGVSLLTEEKNLKIFMVLLAASILIGIFISGITESLLILTIVLMGELIFFIILFIKLLNFIFQHREVTISSLYSAITSYLILGIVFAIFYTLVGTLSSTLFHYTAGAQPILNIFPHPSFFSDALYFSFVTLSTLGYGDWIPVFGPIKMIAALEAIIGQLFIAILIARLVTMHKTTKVTNH